jgi:signal peptidase I
LIRKNLLVIAACSVLLAACSLQPVRIEGTGMSPTLNDGDKIFIDKNLGELKRGDIILFYYPKDRSKSYMKRIIGLPNETVEIREGRIYIDDQILDEPYLDETRNQQKSSFRPQRIPEYQYFVVGDNRDNSSDSRYWGTVDKELIIGKYYMAYSEAKK